MTTIKVVEFRLPHGQRIEHEVEVSDATASVVEKFGDRYEVQMEVLRTGETSITIMDDEEGFDVEIDIIRAGVDAAHVIERIEQMVQKFGKEQGL